MGNTTGLLTWAQYTHLGWSDAFKQATHANGYFLKYEVRALNPQPLPPGYEVTLNPQPLPPGADPLGNFFFSSLPTSDFLLAGNTSADLAFPPENIQTLLGRAGPDLPEPSTAALLLGGGLILMRSV